MAERKEALVVILKGSALQTLRIQFCFSSANGWHLVLLTVDDSFQRNCCAPRAYLEGNEGFLAYFSSSILALSLWHYKPFDGGLLLVAFKLTPPVSSGAYGHFQEQAFTLSGQRMEIKIWKKEVHSLSLSSNGKQWCWVGGMRGTRCKIDVFEHLTFVISTLIKCWGCFSSPHATGESNLSMDVWGRRGVSRTPSYCLRHLTGGRSISSLEQVPDFEIPDLGG